MSSPGSNPSAESPPGVCPVCGSALSRLPMVNGSGYLEICSKCDYQHKIETAGPPPVENPSPATTEDSQRFRRLLAEGEQPVGPDEWPDELLEDLPPEARRALKGKPPSTDTSPPTDEIPDHVKRTLMDYGFAIDEDSRGLRLSSPGGLRRPGTGDLSATDVVRLASQLGGAPPPPKERRTCPSCQAVLPRTATRCSWCDADLPPLDTES